MMADENRFFRFVWRLNALLLAGALVLAACWLAVAIGSDLFVARTTEARVVEFRKNWEPRSSYSLNPADVTGTLWGANGEQLYVLTENRTDPTKPQSDVSTVRNLLAVNEKAGTSRWLFDHARPVILDNMLVYNFSGGQTATSRVVGSALVVADADSNRDGVIDEQDRQTLYFYRMDGKSPIKILSADKIQMEPSNWQDSKLRAFYQEGKASFVARYSLPDLTLEAKIPVQDLPNLGKPGMRVMKIGFITEPKNTED